MNPTLDKLFAVIILLMSLAFAASLAHAECQPIVLHKYEGIDWNCRLFRRTTHDGIVRFERLRPDRTVISIENVDCSKAVPVEGALMYHLHIITGDAYCGPAPRHLRKKQ